MNIKFDITLKYSRWAVMETPTGRWNTRRQAQDYANVLNKQLNPNDKPGQANAKTDPQRKEK